MVCKWKNQNTEDAHWYNVLNSSWDWQRQYLLVVMAIMTWMSLLLHQLTAQPKTPQTVCLVYTYTFKKKKRFPSFLFFALVRSLAGYRWLTQVRIIWAGSNEGSIHKIFCLVWRKTLIDIQYSGSMIISRSRRRSRSSSTTTGKEKIW